MYALLKKELQLFLSSLMGLMVIVVFLTINGLLLFVFPSPFNIFDYGFAGVEPFFQLAPFVFLFLIPAISMRSFAEERKIGTMEGLLSRPLTDLQIILAKYGAILILLFLALLPCLTYIYAVSALASPVGNVDMAAFWGAYMGLLLLGASFASISLFMSSLTDNQIVAFILSVLVCAFFYMGFDLIASMGFLGKFDLIISYLGIQAHYVSLSRGVLDLRDILYYLSLITFFILCTKLSIQAIRWK